MILSAAPACKKQQIFNIRHDQNYKMPRWLVKAKIRHLKRHNMLVISIFDSNATETSQVLRNFSDVQVITFSHQLRQKTTNCITKFYIKAVCVTLFFPYICYKSLAQIQALWQEWKKLLSSVHNNTRMPKKHEWIGKRALFSASKPL